MGVGFGGPGDYLWGGVRLVGGGWLVWPRSGV